MVAGNRIVGRLFDVSGISGFGNADYMRTIYMQYNKDQPESAKEQIMTNGPKVSYACLPVVPIGAAAQKCIIFVDF